MRMDDDAVLAEAGAAARAEHWLSHMMKASVSDDTITYNTVIKAETGKEREGERQGRREREGGERERQQASKREGRRARTAKREGSKRSKAGPYTLPNSRSPASGGNYW